MYQLSERRTNALNYSVGDHKDLINAQLKEYQENEGIHFSDVKGVFEHLLSSALSQDNTQIEPNSTEEIQEITSDNIQELVPKDDQEIITYTPEFESIIESAIIEIGYDTRPTLEVLITDLVEIIKTPLDTIEPIEIEKVVEKMIERPLTENEVLLDFSEKELYALNLIARWRSSKKLVPERESIPTVIKGMVFNPGTLFNEHGHFPTGLIPKKVKR